MNRLLIAAASRAAAPSRSCTISTSSYSSFATSRCIFATRHFSDSITNIDTSTSPDNTDNDDIKTGVVKHFNTKEAYGFIIPSWIDESKLQENDKIFIHRNDIRMVKLDGSSSTYYPNLRRGDKVQFKLGPPDEGKKNGKAHDLTMEGGQIVAPFPRDHLERYMKTCKARFGDEVYDIFSTSKDQNELESKIVAAYDKVHEAIEKRREHVKKSFEACGLEYHE